MKIEGQPITAGIVGFTASLSLSNLSYIASALAGFATFALLLPDVIDKWQKFFNKTKTKNESEK